MSVRRGVALAVVALAIGGLGLVGLMRQRPWHYAAGDLGTITVIGPFWPVRAVDVLFTGAGGVNAESLRLAGELTRDGTEVLVIDTRDLLARYSAGTAGCRAAAGSVDNLVRTRERALGFDQAREPVLIGLGTGAAVAYATLAAAPPLSFAGGVGLDFDPRITTQRPWCGHPDRTPDTGGRPDQPATPADGLPWRALTTRPPSAADPALAYAGEGQTKVLVAGDDVAAQLSAARDEVRAQRAARLAERSVGSLPLVELTTRGAGDAFVVLLSGDGGWRDLDRDLAGRLQERGIPVLGWDSLRYFWSARRPEEAAADLARVIAHYAAAWQRPHCALVGFSFGADVLPFLYARLPPSQRASVRLVALISPSRRTDFEVHVSDWFSSWLGTTAAGTYDVTRALHALPAAQTLCLYGSEESHRSLCTDAAAASVQVLQRRGGHHLDGDYDALADTLLQALRRSVASIREDDGRGAGGLHQTPQVARLPVG